MSLLAFWLWLSFANRSCTQNEKKTTMNNIQADKGLTVPSEKVHDNNGHVQSSLSK